MKNKIVIGVAILAIFVSTFLYIKHDKFPKSVFIQCLVNGGRKSVATGTGFFVKFRGSTIFITNWHLISGRELTGEIKNVIPEAIGIHILRNKIKVDTAITVGSNWGAYTDPAGWPWDIVAVDVPNDIGYDIEYFDLDKTDDYEGDDTICKIVGFPRSYIKDESHYYTPKEFNLSLEKFPLSDSIIALDAELFAKGGAIKWTNNLEEGLSGSPVISSDGKLMGIYSLKMAAPDKLDAPFAFYWKVSYIKKFLAIAKGFDRTQIK